MARHLPLLASLLLLASCNASNNPAESPHQTQAQQKNPASASEFTKPPETSGGQVVVAAYNVKNFLRMERWVDGQLLPDLPKPQQEVEAMVRVISDISPDILVVSEMGGKQDFADFCKLLSGAGLDYPHTEHLEAADQARHLALLSRLPIVSRDSVPRLEFILHGAREYMQRGILDVTIQITPDYQLRVLGAHLKSKRPVPQGEALLRRNEAHLLRKHIDSILADNPHVNLLLAGDLNDTKNEPPIQEIMGQRGSPNSMSDIWLRDQHGDRWTHFWSAADIYSRIDYIMVSQGLFREVDKEKSYVYRSPYMLDASDHRPVVVLIHPEDR